MAHSPPIEELCILLIGNGGREDALTWKLEQSPSVQRIYVLPGNGATAAGRSKTENVTHISPGDFAAITAFASEHGVNLVIPGPEAPLVAGLTNVCRAAGLRCFGPSARAARMEGSKAFAKDFMQRHRIPTARYGQFTRYEDAAAYIEKVDFPVVIKADGLAAGKGVIIPQTPAEADEALRRVLVTREFGDAGNAVVVEEFLEGQELSVLAFCDGYITRTLPPAQDHKQVYDGDQGPMTGGMGCYAPTKVATPALMNEIHRTVLQPTLNGMRREGYPFVGLLFVGLMMTAQGPRVLEYNVRFGDPECQTVLPLLSPSVDLAQVMLACTDGYLDAVTLSVQDRFAATVIAVAGGYPGSYAKGIEIQLATPPEGCVVFHAGTAVKSGQLTTNGGRVLAVTATADSLEAAVELAYRGMESVKFDQMHYRRDIGHRALRSTETGLAAAHHPDKIIQSTPPTHSTIDVPPTNLSTAQTSAGQPLTYAAAGVDVEAGNVLVTRIKPLVRSTARPGADASIGGFGGLFDLAAAGYAAESPRLVAAIDGVGTKLFLAHALGRHDTVGIDCVAMNVNDLVVQGAEPLFFLDCYTCSALDVDVATAFVAGVVRGCQQARCALVGGETAEMPGLFTSQGGDSKTIDSGNASQTSAHKDAQAASSGNVYDAVGASVGALAHGAVALPHLTAMQPGQVLLGLASNGCHSNGYSLIRKILDREGLRVTDPAPWLQSGDASASKPAHANAVDVDVHPADRAGSLSEGSFSSEQMGPSQTSENSVRPSGHADSPHSRSKASEVDVGTALLAPTRIYVRSLLAAMRRDLILGAAHITGGGLVDNIPRMLPGHLAAQLDAQTWPLPAVQRWLCARGPVPPAEVARTWNCGLGMVVVVRPEDVENAMRVLRSEGETVWRVGQIVQKHTQSEAGCVVQHMEVWTG